MQALKADMIPISCNRNVVSIKHTDGTVIWFMFLPFRPGKSLYTVKFK